MVKACRANPDVELYEWEVRICLFRHCKELDKELVSRTIFVPSTKKN